MADLEETPPEELEAEDLGPGEFVSFDSDTSPAIQSAFPKVTAVVLNYDGKEVTLQSLASLEKLRYPNFELLVVDNGSTDGSAAAIAEKFPLVDLIRRDTNEGVAPGLNMGILKALHGDCDYLLLLNNDIEVAPSMLAEMVDLAESNRRAGCVGPKAYYYWDRDRLWSTGGEIRFRESVTTERGMGEVDRGQFDEPVEVDYVNGCAMLIRRAVLEQVGLFDPVYQVGVEDADWCVRMRERGYICGYAPRAELWHMVAQTAGGYTSGRTYHVGRGSAIFARRYAGTMNWLTFWAGVLAAMPIAYVRELFRGNEEAVLAKWRGVMDGMRVPLDDPPGIPEKKA
jgi:GT2 family glycosyltransferase